MAELVLVYQAASMMFTTSWDDGTKTDLGIAELLDKHGCKGTFYICPLQRKHPLLSKSDIVSLAKNHEIGAHTMTHPHLTKIPESQARQEIEDSKTWVQKQAGKDCTMFCYPYGDTNAGIKKLVQGASYQGARTTERFGTKISDSFSMPTTLQLIPFPARKECVKWWHKADPYGPLRVRAAGLLGIGTTPKHWSSWLNMATALFDRCLQSNAEHFHLWGHSSEVQKFDLWNDLDRFLGHVAASKVKPMTNSEVLSATNE